MREYNKERVASGMSCYVTISILYLILHLDFIVFRKELEETQCLIASKVIDTRGCQKVNDTIDYENCHPIKYRIKPLICENEISYETKETLYNGQTCYVNCPDTLSYDAGTIYDFDYIDPATAIGSIVIAGPLFCSIVLFCSSLRLEKKYRENEKRRNTVHASVSSIVRRPRRRTRSKNVSRNISRNVSRNVSREVTDSSDTNSNECTICMKNDIQVCLPCGHAIMCFQCAKKITSCPFCRAAYNPNIINV